MYRHDIYRFIDSIEHEYKYAGNYGAKGEKRQKKQKRSSEDIQRQNQYQKTKRVRRIIKANFRQGDYWITLTYQKGESRSVKEVCKDLSSFLRRIRAAYTRQDTACKYIYRIEIGSRGGIHVHMILNRLPDLDQVLQSSWNQGRVHTEYLDNGTYEKLAEYIVKPPTDQQRRLLQTFGEEDSRKLIKYSRSRNLVIPEPEKHEYSRRTMRSVFNHDLEPTEGFYIDPDSVIKGVNYFTGMSYLQYQEIRLTKNRKPEPIRFCECPYCHQMTLFRMECSCMNRRRRKRR